MLTLANKGMVYSELARMFGVDHSSIMYQCKKNGISNGITLSSQKFREAVKKGIKENKLKPNYSYVEGEVFNRGHTYKEYLAIEKEKRLAKVS